MLIQKEIAKLISNRAYFKCEICSKSKFAKVYEYKSVSVVSGYETTHFKNICRDCIYRECFGSKECRMKKKEGVLDG